MSNQDSNRPTPADLIFCHHQRVFPNGAKCGVRLSHPMHDRGATQFDHDFMTVGFSFADSRTDAQPICINVDEDGRCTALAFWNGYCPTHARTDAKGEPPKDEPMVAFCACVRSLHKLGEASIEPEYGVHGGCPSCGRPWVLFAENDVAQRLSAQVVAIAEWAKEMAVAETLDQIKKGEPTPPPTKQDATEEARKLATITLPHGQSICYQNLVGPIAASLTARDREIERLKSLPWMRHIEELRSELETVRSSLSTAQKELESWRDCWDAACQDNHAQVFWVQEDLGPNCPVCELIKTKAEASNLKAEREMLVRIADWARMYGESGILSEKSGPMNAYRDWAEKYRIEGEGNQS